MAIYTQAHLSDQIGVHVKLLANSVVEDTGKL